MSTSIRILTLTMTCSYLLAAATWADEGETELTPEQEKKLQQLEAAEAALHDAAFERFVAIQDVQEAYDSLDVEMLIDCALQLHEGGSVLLRNHNSGLTAETLLSLALKVCVSKGQVDHLNRLAKAAKAIGAEDLAERVRASRRLAEQTRTAGRPTGQYAWVLDMIQNAELQGDAERLDFIVEKVLGEIPEPTRSNALGEAKAAKKRLADAPANEALDKLAAPSRLVIPWVTGTTLTPFLISSWPPNGHGDVDISFWILGAPTPGASYRLDIFSSHPSLFPIGINNLIGKTPKFYRWQNLFCQRPTAPTNVAVRVRFRTRVFGRTYFRSQTAQLVLSP